MKTYKQISMLILAALSSRVSSQTCGAGNWHIGFDLSAGVQIQAMDYFDVGTESGFIIGGAVSDGSIFNSVSGPTQPGPGALLSTHIEATSFEEANNECFIIQEDMQNGIQIVGVSALVVKAMDDMKDAFGVFQTANSNDDVVVFWLRHHNLNHFDLFIQRLDNTDPWCLPSQSAISAYEDESVFMTLDPCSGGSANTIELFGLDLIPMIIEDAGVQHRYSLDRGPLDDWSTKAAFTGKFVSGNNVKVNELPNTQVSWVGEGTCDTGDGMGQEMSIIYIATSFGEDFKANETPGNHYVCSQCIGSDITGASGYFDSFKVVATSGTQLDKSVIFVEGVRLGNSQILTLATNTDRCGALEKRLIHITESGVNHVYFMGWKLDGYGPSDYKGTITLKIINNGTVSFKLVKGFNPYDKNDNTHTKHKIKIMTSSFSLGLQDMFDSVTSVFVDQDLNYSIFIGDSFVIQSTADCSTPTCDTFCLSTSMKVITGPGSSYTSAVETLLTNHFPSRDYSTLELEYRRQNNDYQFYDVKLNQMSETDRIDASLLLNHSLTNPCKYTLTAPFSDPIVHPITAASPTNAFIGQTVSSSDVCPDTSSPSATNHVVLLTELEDSNGSTVPLSSQTAIIDNFATVIIANDLSQVDLYTVRYKIGFHGESFEQILACVHCEGAYSLQVVCAPNFPPDQTINITVDLFEASTVYNFDTSVTNGCTSTELTYDNSPGSTLFTHNNAGSGSTTSVIIDVLADNEDLVGTNIVFVIETSLYDPLLIFQRKIIATVLNQCDTLNFNYEAIDDIQINTGDPSLTISIPNFSLDPPLAVALCPPGITHEYTYSVVSGTVDPSWLVLDVVSKEITVTVPEFFNSNIVEDATFSIEVTQRVLQINNPTSEYCSVQSTFYIEIINQCAMLNFIYEDIDDNQLKTGDPALTISIPDFSLGPPPAVALCLPVITHEYTYTVVSGAVDPSWLVLDVVRKKITVTVPEYFNGNIVEDAAFSITVTQKVLYMNNPTFVYCSMQSTFFIEIIRRCGELQLESQSLPYQYYTAGQGQLNTLINDFNLTPFPVDPLCQGQGLTHTYSYTMVSGAIDSSWLMFDEQTHRITFDAPLYINEPDLVEEAEIEITVTQTVLSASGSTIATASANYHIIMSQGTLPTSPCEEAQSTVDLTLQHQVQMFLGDIPIEYLVTSQFLSCTNTSFSIQFANNTEVDQTIALLETTLNPPQAKVTFFATQLDTFHIEVKEYITDDPTRYTITSFEVLIEDPCEQIGLTAEEYANHGYTVGSGSIELEIGDFELNPVDVADKCPLILHTYKFNMLCGTIQSEWLVLDPDQHKVSFQAPKTFEQYGREVDVPPAVINIDIVQSVEEDGHLYASTTSSFKIYMGDSSSGCEEETEEITEDQQGAYKPPVHLAIHSMSIDGNLTLAFSRPLVIPQVLQDLVVEPERELNTNYLTIKDLIDLFVMSSVHDWGSDATYIEDYQLTRFTERAFDIQVTFKRPDQITQIVTEPDRLGMRFKDNNLFEGQVDEFLELLDMNAEIDHIEVELVPQISQLDMAEIYGTEEQAKQALNVVSATNLILNCLLYVGLKYLWNMVNLLQFEVFMLLWQVSIPYKAEAFLKYIKLLALMEFVPSGWLTDAISEVLSIQCEEEDLTCQDTVDESERTGLTKLGSTNIVSNMGIMLLIAVLILIFVGLLLLMKRCMYYDYRLYRAYMKMRQRIFWNTFIRYALQSQLKLLISAGSVLALESSREEPNKMNMIFPATMLSFLLMCPLLFLHIMLKYRQELGKPIVKDRIGTLYLGLRTDRDYVVSYSMVFILRRVVFMVITFTLFNYPGIQIQVFIYTSLLYIIYISHMYFHEPSWSKDLEIVNEAIFLHVCYHIVIFVNLLWDTDLRDLVGKSLVWTTSTILIMNISIIVIVSVKAVMRKLKLRQMRQNALKKRMLEIAEEIRIQEKQNIIAEMEQMRASGVLPGFEQSQQQLYAWGGQPESNAKLKGKKWHTKKRARTFKRKPIATLENSAVLQDCKVEDVEGADVDGDSSSSCYDSESDSQIEEVKAVDMPVPVVSAYKELSSSVSDEKPRALAKPCPPITPTKSQALKRQNQFTNASRKQLTPKSSRQKKKVNSKQPVTKQLEIQADFGTTISYARERADTGYNPNLDKEQYSNAQASIPNRNMPQLTDDEVQKLRQIRKSVIDRIKSDNSKNPYQGKMIK